MSNQIVDPNGRAVQSKPPLPTHCPNCGAGTDKQKPTLGGTVCMACGHQ